MLGSCCWLAIYLDSRLFETCLRRPPVNTKRRLKDVRYVAIKTFAFVAFYVGNTVVFVEGVDLLVR